MVSVHSEVGGEMMHQVIILNQSATKGSQKTGGKGFVCGCYVLALTAGRSQGG